MKRELEIFKVLCVSTGHIRFSDQQLLQLVSPPELIAHTYEEGWWIWVAGLDDIQDRASLCRAAGYSEDLLNLLQLARDNGCDWLRLDADGPVVEGLPTFNW